MTKEEALKKYFGYDSFRGIQGETIESILNNHDTIVLLATGGGKSIIYQIPALMLEGISIIVTPLISLMVDQVKNLNKLNIKARYLNSLMESDEQREVYEEIEKGVVKIIYASPERLQNKRFISLIADKKVSMLCLDESHSVTGRYGFRMAYDKIDEFIDLLKNRPVIAALTATARDDTINDIIKICKMENPKIFKNSFDRPNLYYGVVKVKDKIEYLKEYITNHNERGIIYTSTRAICELLYKKLRELGFLCSIYHGGMESSEKLKNQNEYVSGGTKIMVATISFGLGIDIPDIRYVILYNIPSSLEDLSQMIGRCSRDNKYGEGIVLWTLEDIKIGLHFIYSFKEDSIDRRTFLREKEGRKDKLNSVVSFCLSRGCLRHKLLGYFGENSNKRCNNCSWCNKKW